MFLVIAPNRDAPRVGEPRDPKAGGVAEPIEVGGVRLDLENTLRAVEPRAGNT